MLTEVRICGRKLFHPYVWRVLINGHKWLYDQNEDVFICCYDRYMGYKHLWVICDDEYGIWADDSSDKPAVVAKKDMPIAVHLGFSLAWDDNKLLLYMRYSQRRSYGWKLLIGTLQAEGRDIVVFSRGRRMGVVQLVDETGNPLKKIPIAPVLA